MDISKENYELYAIDYLEGNLSPTEVAMFMAFLAEYPEIAREIECLKPQATLELDRPTKNNFNNLKKDLIHLTVNEQNFDEMCIAYHEGDLDNQASSKLINYVSSGKKHQDRFKIFGELKISADTAVKFPDTSTLTKTKTTNVFLLRTFQVCGIAAAIALLVVFFTRPNYRSQLPVAPIAVVNVQPENSHHEKPYIINKEHRPPSVHPIDKKPIVGKSRTSLKKKAVITQKETQLAVYDTSSTGKDKIILIAGIKAQGIPSNYKEPVLNWPHETGQKTPSPILNPGIKEIKQRGHHFLAKASTLTVTDIIKGSVKGINRLTETELEYDAITDKNGKVIEYALSAENFNVRRKTRRN